MKKDTYLELIRKSREVVITALSTVHDELEKAIMNGEDTEITITVPSSEIDRFPMSLIIEQELDSYEKTIAQETEHMVNVTMYVSESEDLMKSTLSVVFHWDSEAE